MVIARLRARSAPRSLALPAMLARTSSSRWSLGPPQRAQGRVRSPAGAPRGQQLVDDLRLDTGAGAGRRRAAVGQPAGRGDRVGPGVDAGPGQRLRVVAGEEPGP